MNTIDYHNYAYYKAVGKSAQIDAIVYHHWISDGLCGAALALSLEDNSFIPQRDLRKYITDLRLI